MKLFTTLARIQINVKLFINPTKIILMKQELELQAIPTGKVLFKLTILGGLLLGCVYGFIVLFNSALEAIK